MLTSSILVQGPELRPSPSFAAPGGWPNNEPAGLSPVYTGSPTPGRMVDGSELFLDYTGQSGSDIGAELSFGAKWGTTHVGKTTQAGSPFANVLRHSFFIDDDDGWNGVATDSNYPLDYEELYWRYIFRYSSNWQIHGNGEKFWMFGHAASGGSAFVMHLAANERVALTNQSGSSGDGGEWRSTQAVSLGEWHTIELHMVAQSEVGVSDGSFECHFDGTNITSTMTFSGGSPPDQDNINWFNSGASSRLWSGQQFFLYWGGSTNIKTVNDHIDLGEFYLTGKSAVS